MMTYVYVCYVRIIAVYIVISNNHTIIKNGMIIPESYHYIGNGLMNLRYIRRYIKMEVSNNHTIFKNGMMIQELYHFQK